MSEAEAASAAPLLVRLLRGEAVERAPVWAMFTLVPVGSTKLSLLTNGPRVWTLLMVRPTSVWVTFTGSCGVPLML